MRGPASHEMPESTAQQATIWFFLIRTMSWPRQPSCLQWLNGSWTPDATCYWPVLAESACMESRARNWDGACGRIFCPRGMCSPPTTSGIVAGPVPRGKFYRREFVVRGKLRFPSLARSEDVPFVQTAMACSEKIAVFDGVLGHSYAPIRMTSIIGICMAGLSFLAGAFVFVWHFFDVHIMSGFTTIILALLFLGGIQMLMIGILGEYLWRVLAQTRQDPPFIVEEELS